MVAPNGLIEESGRTPQALRPLFFRNSLHLASQGSWDPGVAIRNRQEQGNKKQDQLRHSMLALTLSISCRKL